MDKRLKTVGARAVSHFHGQLVQAALSVHTLKDKRIKAVVVSQAEPIYIQLPADPPDFFFFFLVV